MLGPATCRVKRWLVTCEPFSLTGSCKWVWSSVYCRKRCTWLWESSTAFFRWVTSCIKAWSFCHTPLPYQINTPIFFFFLPCSNRTTQSPRSSCSWSAWLPCFLLPNTRKCIPLRSQTLPMWQTGLTPLPRSEKWRWTSYGCSNSSWADLFPCSSSGGPQRSMRYCHCGTAEV